MSSRLDALFEFVRKSIIEPLGRLVPALAAGVSALFLAALRFRGRLVLTVALAALAYGLYTHPPFATASRGEVLVRANMLNGSVSAYSAGTVLVLPGIHQARRYTTRDQMYRPAESASATGPAPFQSNEGLSIGVDLTVRWAIDRAHIAQTSKDFPDDLNNDLVRPAVQGIVYPLFARYSVREIFSGRRAEIQQEITKELKPRLAVRGLLLRGVDMGQVDLPSDYRAGMEKLLAEELETEKVRYTLELKESQVKQTELEAEADTRRATPRHYGATTLPQPSAKLSTGGDTTIQSEYGSCRVARMPCLSLCESRSSSLSADWSPRWPLVSAPSL